MKLYKTKKDPELYYYYNAKGEKMWCYRHRYYDPLGKRREKYKQGFKNENEAYRALLELKTNILNGNIKQIENENITVSEWIDLWYETKKVSWKKSTCIERKRIIDDAIKPLIGKYKLSKLDAITYERVFINKLLKELAPGTVKHYHSIFKTAVNAAVTNKTIAENNFKSIRINDSQKKENNFLSAKELNTLLDVAKKEAHITDYTLILTLASTGMRKGEANGLKWKDIDFKKKTIKIERTRDEHGVRPPKTTNSYRTIPIDNTLIAQLELYRIWCKKKMFSLGKHLSNDDFVFISSNGIVRNDHMAINEALERIIKKAKVKRITPHGLRHTHATILLNKGMSATTVAKRLGNTAVEIYRTYGHSDEEADRQAVEIFSSIINSN